MDEVHEASIRISQKWPINYQQARSMLLIADEASVEWALGVGAALGFQERYKLYSGFRVPNGYDFAYNLLLRTVSPVYSGEEISDALMKAATREGGDVEV